jgi:uncharacterized protein
MIIDFHTHCFADSIVEKAMGILLAKSGYTASTDGSVSGLRQSMVKSDIDICVLHSIATKPSQTKKINDWTISICSDDIIPFGSVHPEYDDWEIELERLENNGVKGIKFHPDYQGFFVDEKRMYPIYEKIAELDMLIMFHCGYDIAYPDIAKCPPHKLINVVNDIPSLKIIGAHMGGYKMLDEIFEYLTGSDLYLDTSFSHFFMNDEETLKLIRKHGSDKILFGSDSPWDDVNTAIESIDRLKLSSREKEMIFSQNALELLKI